MQINFHITALSTVMATDNHLLVYISLSCVPTFAMLTTAGINAEDHCISKDSPAFVYMDSWGNSDHKKQLPPPRTLLFIGTYTYWYLSLLLVTDDMLSCILINQHYTTNFNMHE